MESVKQLIFSQTEKKCWDILHISGLLLLGFSISGSTKEYGQWTNMNKGNVLRGLLKVDLKKKN